MAEGYNATLQVICWKEHECFCCGSVFRYRFQQKGVGVGPTQDVAAKAAETSAAQAVENHVQLQACPSCGAYQPDMIGHWRARYHGWILLIAAVVLCALISGEGAMEFLNAESLNWAVGLGGLAVLCHLFVAFRPFHANLDGNRRRAERARDEGRLQIIKEFGSFSTDIGDKFRQGGLVVALLLLVAGLAIIPLAEVIRVHKGWPRNSDWRIPVVGPGDASYIFFPDQIVAVNNIWRGNATAQILNAQELGLADDLVRAETSTKEWDNSISISKNESDRTHPRIWARVHVPDVPQSQGKTMRVEMFVDAVYPSPLGKDRFEVKQGSFRHTANVVLAEPGAGGMFKMLWWTMGLGGTLVTTLGGIFLWHRAKGLMKRANPARVVPIAPDGRETTKSNLIASSPITIVDPNNPFQHLELSQINSRIRRSRIGFYFFLALIIGGCIVPMTLVAILPGKADGIWIGGAILIGIVGGFIGAILMGMDLRRYKRLYREKLDAADRQLRQDRGPGNLRGRDEYE